MRHHENGGTFSCGKNFYGVSKVAGRKKIFVQPNIKWGRDDFAFISNAVRQRPTSHFEMLGREIIIEQAERGK